MNVIVEREKMLIELEERIAALRKSADSAELSGPIRELADKYAEIQREIFGSMTPWQRVNMARHPKRPIGSDYIAAFDIFDELHGDRHYRDDAAVIGGFAKLNGRRIILLAQQKGRDVKENVRRNFGMASPEGYRKVQRLLKLGEHLRLPIVSLVDTSGADPGIASEEHAQGEAIAATLEVLADLRVPTVAAVIGEGGSGGALALALSNWVMMLEHSVYSVASPEGCAAILWSDSSKAEEAAERLKLTSDDLYRFGIIDQIVPEPMGGAHRDTERTIRSVLDAIDAVLTRLATLPERTLVDERYAKFRKIGAWQTENRARLVAEA